VGDQKILDPCLRRDDGVLTKNLVIPAKAGIQTRAGSFRNIPLDLDQCFT
jgi:hypothetical protein